MSHIKMVASFTFGQLTQPTTAAIGNMKLEFNIGNADIAS